MLPVIPSEQCSNELLSSCYFDDCYEMLLALEARCKPVAIGVKEALRICDSFSRHLNDKWAIRQIGETFLGRLIAFRGKHSNNRFLLWVGDLRQEFLIALTGKHGNNRRSLIGHLGQFGVWLGQYFTQTGLHLYNGNCFHLCISISVL